MIPRPMPPAGKARRGDGDGASSSRRGTAFHRALIVAGLAAACAAWTVEAKGRSLSTSTLTNLVFQQNLGVHLDRSLGFQNEHGRDIALNDCFNGKPGILVLGYYQCPMLCNLVLNGLVESLQHLKATAGMDFSVIFVSIDPAERFEIAAAKKKTYLKRYGRPGAESGWHFLTGREAAIRQLSEQAGFRYAYDPEIRQYAHPSGLIVLTPEARVARYLFGVSYPPDELNDALNLAAARKTASPARQLLMLCFRIMPLTGKYSDSILITVRVLGAMTLLGLLAFVVATCRRSRKGPPHRLAETTTGNA